MAEDPPERLSFSIPADSPIDSDAIDDLVEQSECESRSELIRELLAEANDERQRQDGMQVRGDGSQEDKRES